MTQSKQDLENIKSKIIEHIKKTYEEQKANEFITNINSMSENQFIEFLKQQGMLPDENSQPPGQQCIFCSMVFGDIPTTKIGENQKSIAILELNPISQGHSLIIPKEHIKSEETLPAESKKLAIQISEQLKKTFNPQRVDLIQGNIMGHQIINLIPIYSNETIESPRQTQTPEGLTQLKKQIENAQPTQISLPTKTETTNTPIETKEKITAANTWLPKRIP